MNSVQMSLFQSKCGKRQKKNLNARKNLAFSHMYISWDDRKAERSKIFVFS